MTDLSGITSPLETVEGYGHGRFDVFRDWVRLMLASLQRDDETYLGILEEYDRGRDRPEGSRPPDLFSEAFGELMVKMEETNRDVLGDVYEELGAQKDAFGQHFTPHPTVRSLAEMNTVAVNPDPPVTVADPTCGSGRMLVYAAAEIDEHTLCFGRDLDLTCAQMSALNCCFFNIDSVVVWGDSLKCERRRAWKTTQSAIGGSVREVDPDELTWPTASVEEADVEDVPTEERVSVNAGGGELSQSDLNRWSEGP